MQNNTKIINEVSAEVRPKVKEFLRLTDLHFSFLKNYGYNEKEEKIAKQYAVKNMIDVIYKNVHIDRAIVINFQPNKIDGSISNYLSVTFYKGIKFMDKELWLSLYIKKYKPDIDITLLNEIDKNNKPTFEENIAKAMSGFEYFVKDIGIGLVDGSEWEDGLIYDWSSAEKMLYDEQKRILGENNENEE
jgi:hypothetical protein